MGLIQEMALWLNINVSKNVLDLKYEELQLLLFFFSN